MGLYVTTIKKSVECIHRKREEKANPFSLASAFAKFTIQLNGNERTKE